MLTSLQPITFTMTVTLFVPTINEIDGMRAMMGKIPPEWCQQILVVDGGSTDGTIEYARELGFDVYQQKQKGIHHGYAEAWPLIKGQIVITFSPDGNCRIEDIPLLIAKMNEGYDMVVASRYLGGLRSEDDTAITRFGNWLFTTMINICHGGKFTDAMGIYRAYRTNLFHELDMHRDDAYAMERLFGVKCGLEPLLSIRAAKNKCKISEIPSPEPRRLGGESKMMAFRWGSVFLIQIFRELYFWRPKKQS